MKKEKLSVITLDQYAGIFAGRTDWNITRQQNAITMLSIVNAMLIKMRFAGCVFDNNPVTRNLISGITYGGFRPQDCPQGAPNSSHKEGCGIDIYDPDDKLDDYITEHPELLEQFNLYREHPSATLGWLHLTTRAPNSGKRTFYP